MTHEPSMLDEILGDLTNESDYIAEGLALGIVEDAMAIMEAQGMSKARLADAMRVSRAYVTKVFNAPPNLTLRTIAQISLAIGARPVFHLEPARRGNAALAAEIGGALGNLGTVIGTATATLPGFGSAALDSLGSFVFSAEHLYEGSVSPGQYFSLSTQEDPNWNFLKNYDLTSLTNFTLPRIDSGPSKIRTSSTPPTSTVLSTAA